ncbi:MAG TPA: hypothetical protein VN841_26080 [Bryobacteraceae bacterium]|nr:hypothetical protein [Bryobacteraceae bacterium]
MSNSYFRENEWWVSPYNLIPEVQSKFELPARVSIHDATLRDGEQTPGVVFSVSDKIAIAEKLAEVGVERIEAGMPAVSDQDFQAVRELSKLGLKSKIYTFAQAIAGRRGDVVLGKKSGKMSIAYHLEQLGITSADDESIGEMLRRVKDRGIEKRGLLAPDEFRETVDGVMAVRR